ncbi:GNAT family N-acetyltransferase [uncultured Campylobacter sp.]|uniref:GNAT family N-acetyltransferase n=1 Tax=uncultured Campylobacter sp. TaxID=218934 RepID=UPI002612C3E7|nr:GNAT family N-acetyltransferase [uncultured Campylobacter sp.]
MILNAQKVDAARCIELLNLAMEDIAFTLSGVSDPAKSDEILHKFFRSEINRLSYNNVFVFKFDGEIAGVICAYDGGEIDALDEPIRTHLRTLGSTEFPQTECFADELYIDSLVVDERFRGRGIAKELIKFIFTLAPKRNIKKVALIVDEKKPKTMAFYERLGFKADCEMIINSHKYYHMTKEIE